MSLLVVELAASCLLLLVAALVRARRRPTLPSRLIPLVALGVLNPGLAYALGLWGLASIGASMSVLLWAAEPILVLVLASVVLRERLIARTAGLVGTACAGVLVVTYNPGASGSAHGIMLTLAAVSACACYTVLTRRMHLDDSASVVVLVQQATALGFAVVLAVGSAYMGLADLRFPSDVATWALAAASGTVYYGLAFWFFVGGLRGVAASTAGALLPLTPVFGLIAGRIAGDQLTGRAWGGAALIVLATVVLGIHEARRTTTTA